MTKVEFLELMRFPKEWLELGMYPDELFDWQISGYEPGHENGAEHDRNGAFHWWLKKQPSKSELQRLICLAAIDPDPFLAEDLGRYIQQSPSFDHELAELEKKLFARSTKKTDAG
jgi:hypothetical protein